MSLGMLYPHRQNNNNILKRSFYMVVLMACMVVTYANAQDRAPFFVNGTTQSLSVCMNSTNSINGIMAIADSDVGQTETWSVLLSPSNGMLSGFVFTSTSTGGIITPGGLSYAPNTGFTGLDTFVIGISDGTLSGIVTVVASVAAPAVLSSSLTPPAICDQSVFSYVPASATPGAAFTWRRATTAGLSNPAASGAGNPNETLFNITNADVIATYLYTISAGGCSTSQNVNVIVHPSPRLSTPLYDTTCSGAVFNYVPLPTIAGTTFTWTRAMAAGVSQGSSTGSGNISEILTDTVNVPASVTYSFALSADGCSAIRNVHVQVVPMPPSVNITTASPSSMCAGALYQNFGAAVPPASGITYQWTAVNAGIFAVGADHQYALVSFPNTGTASVSLIVNGGDVHCSSVSTYSVTVGAPEAAGATVLYYNYQFIYQDNTADTYQWGYDNVSTLDSTAVPGATFQSYPDSGPDFIDNYYWVITNRQGCIQKTYFNAPLAVVTNDPGKVAELKLSPNPANDVLHVAVSGVQSDDMTVVLTDVAGQVLAVQNCRSGVAQLSVGQLPAGYYLVNCLVHGVRTSTGRFIKN